MFEWWDLNPCLAFRNPVVLHTAVRNFLTNSNKNIKIIGDAGIRRKTYRLFNHSDNALLFSTTRQGAGIPIIGRMPRLIKKIKQTVEFKIFLRKIIRRYIVNSLAYDILTSGILNAHHIWLLPENHQWSMVFRVYRVYRKKYDKALMNHCTTINHRSSLMRSQWHLHENPLFVTAWRTFDFIF